MSTDRGEKVTLTRAGHIYIYIYLAFSRADQERRL